MIKLPFGYCNAQKGIVNMVYFVVIISALLLAINYQFNIGSIKLENILKLQDRSKQYHETKILTSSKKLLEHTKMNSIDGVTGPGVPYNIRSILSERYATINEEATDFYGAQKAVDELEKECQWNASASTLNHPGCLTQFQFKRRSTSFSISDYHNQVDIVIPSIRDLDFLESWKLFFIKFHLIIIQDGDPSKKLKIPAWADYELYNRNDIDRILGKQVSWIISSQDASIRNFGFLVSKKTFIYTVDDDCLPANDSQGVQVNALLRHIQNLVTNSTPYFFNTLYDPYIEGADFVRGYPYSLRQGVPTAISHGIWLNAPDYDAPTQLLKADERNTRYADITMTVPYGVLYPMCSMNVAFNRQLIGAAFMQGLMGKGMPWARYDDMFAGWASKVIADHLGLGVKTGSPYIRHNKASNPFTNLRKEYKGLFWQEDLINFFQNLRFSSSAKTPEDCYLELAGMIRRQFKDLNAYFGRLADAMEIWVDLWRKSQLNQLNFTPSQSSDIKVTKSSHAILTICRNEAVYLRIWLNYYRRYFYDEDIYILDNDSDDGSTSNLTVNVLRVHSEKYFDHHWLINVVRNQTSNLLSRGYKYVLFTEIDEIIVPNPNVYPLGLGNYIKRFKNFAIRPIAYHLRQNVTLEPKLDFNQPILSQRSYWMRDQLYDKPLLTNKSLHWTPGFHSCTEIVHRDDNLIMFHLQRMDHDFYMRRADWKSRQNLKMDDIRKGMGTQQAYSGSKAEQFFSKIIGTITKVPNQYRIPPVF